MHISAGRGFTFVHIPKTGGTSMALALEARAMADDILIGDTPKAVRRRGRLKGAPAAGRVWKHSTLEEVAGLAPPEALRFVFTLVRNPFDRVLSYWSWLGAQGFDHPQVDLAARLPFGDFLAHPQTRRLLRAWPYGRYVTLGGAERCDAFVRLEHPGDLAPVERVLGFPLRLSHANRSTRRAAHTAASRAVVEEDGAEDLARFRYRFEG